MINEQVITEEEQLGYCAEDILKMLAEHVYNCQTPLRTKLCALIRPYVAIREPVSLENVCRGFHNDNLHIVFPWDGEQCKEAIRKSMRKGLEAAGVKYVD